MLQPTALQNRPTILGQAQASAPPPPPRPSLEAAAQQLAQLAVVACGGAGPGRLADAGDGAGRGCIQDLRGVGRSPRAGVSRGGLTSLTEAAAATPAHHRAGLGVWCPAQPHLAQRGQRMRQARVIVALLCNAHLRSAGGARRSRSWTGPSLPAIAWADRAGWHSIQRFCCPKPSAIPPPQNVQHPPSVPARAPHRLIQRLHRLLHVPKLGMHGPQAERCALQAAARRGRVLRRAAGSAWVWSKKRCR